MPTVRITKEFSFEMAHTLAGYDGACSEIHGHSYRLFVTVVGSPNDDPSDPKYGMVMDFRSLKHIVKEHIVDVFDHALMIRATKTNAPLIEALRSDFSKVHVVDYQPTCENLILRFAETLKGAMTTGAKLYSLKMHETASSYAEWFASDN